MESVEILLFSIKLNQNPYYLKLAHEETLHITETLESVDTPLSTNSRLFMTTEGSHGSDIKMVVDPDSSRLQLLSHSLCCFNVRRPDGGSKTKLGIVGALDDFIFILP